MAMTIEEIKKSGLLELYAMGALEDKERIEVEEALDKYKELRTELSEIEKSLLKYADAHGVEPRPEIRQNIQERISSGKGNSNSENKSGDSGSGFPWNMIFFAATLASIIGLIFIFNQNQNLQKEYSVLEDECDSLNLVLTDQIAFYESAFNQNNKSVKLNATEKYPDSDLVIYLNDDSQRGFIQSLNLPDLATNESFQLWSLIGDNPPAPLDVFEPDTMDQNIFEIEYILNTETYAITIEPKGGSTVPTLENLIGVFPIGA